MKSFWGGMVILVCLAPPAFAEVKPKIAAKSFEVPYRLTVPKHILIRAKLNGKGPYNFILDTGAPALFVATKVAKKLGVEPDSRHWAVFDRVEIEGGVVLSNVKSRIEDPFQLEGMNGLGLAGAELHGIIGYNVLARYRIAIDFNRDKLVWTPLAFDPKAPAGMGGKGGGAGGLEVVGSLMKLLGGMLGKKPAPDVAQRGFLGVEFEDGEEYPLVKVVLDDGPSGKAGLTIGDKVTHVQGRSVINSEDVWRFAKKLRPSDKVRLTVERKGETREIRFQAGEGL